MRKCSGLNSQAESGRVIIRTHLRAYMVSLGTSVSHFCPHRILNKGYILVKFVARKDSVLYQAYEYRGEVYNRFQAVSDIEVVDIGDSRKLLFNVPFDKLMSDIIQVEMKEELQRGSPTGRGRIQKSYKCTKNGIEKIPNRIGRFITRNSLCLIKCY